MKSKKKYIFSILFFIILLVLTFYVLFKNNDIKDIITSLQNITFNYLLIGVALVFVYILAQALYIKVSLKSLDHKINIWQGFVYSCIEFYFSAVTPSSTGGQPAQIYYMSKDNVPGTKSSVVIMLNTVTYKFVILTMALFGIIFFPNLIFNNSVVFTIVFILGIIVNIGMIAVCLMLMYSRKWINRVVKLVVNVGSKLHFIKDREKTLKKFKRLSLDYQKGAKYIKDHFSVAIKVFILTFIQRLSIFAVSFVVYKAFNLSGYSFLELVVVQMAVGIAIDSLPLPGGIGASEAMLHLIYNRIFSEAIAVPAMLVTRGISYYLCLLIAGITVLINHLRITFRKKENIAEN